MLNIYRLIIGISVICIVISENTNYIYELLDVYANNYIQELSYTDNTVLKMDPWGNPYGNPYSYNNPYGVGPSGNVPPSGGPPGNNPTGIESSIENENSKNREQDSGRKANRRRGLEGPHYRYYDNKTHKYVYPEAYHEKEPIYLANKTTRVYLHGGISYTYICDSFHEEDRYCKITYPDGSSAFIYDKETVMKHILFHRKQIQLGHQCNPPFDYIDYYNSRFDAIRKQRLTEYYYKQYNII